MKPLRLSLALLVLSGCLIVPSAAKAADISETARATAVQAQKAVVTIRLVVKIKMSMMGQSQDHEQKVEATGTVIDPAGLTVADASTVDPTSMMKSMFGGAYKVDSEIKETLILLEDGTEVEADVVLNDTDLGLAFIRPRDAARKFDAVTLKPRPTPPQLLDNIFVVGRLGKNGNRAAALSLDTIQALVKGPRPFYVADKTSHPGCVVYSADGEPLGVQVMKQRPRAVGDDGGGMGLGMMTRMGDMRDAIIPIIRPVNDVIEIAAQAKEAKVPAKKEASTPEKKDAPGEAPPK
ncbi:MAG: serine protease [Planctomycetota bacterium]